MSEGSMSNNVEYKLKGLITFADGLIEGQEYRRAIVSVQLVLKESYGR